MLKKMKIKMKLMNYINNMKMPIVLNNQLYKRKFINNNKFKIINQFSKQNKLKIINQFNNQNKKLQCCNENI